MLSIRRLLCVSVSLLAIAASPAALAAQGGSYLVTMPDGSPPIPDHPDWAIVMIITPNPDDSLTGVVWLYRPGEAPVELVNERTTFTPCALGQYSWTTPKGSSGTLKDVGDGKFESEGPNGARQLKPV